MRWFSLFLLLPLLGVACATPQCPDCGANGTMRKAVYSGLPNEESVQILAGNAVPGDPEAGDPLPDQGCLRCRTIETIGHRLESGFYHFRDNIRDFDYDKLTLDTFPGGFRLSYPEQFTIEAGKSRPIEYQNLLLYKDLKVPDIEIYLTGDPDISEALSRYVAWSLKDTSKDVAIDPVIVANRIVITPFSADDQDAIVLTPADDSFKMLTDLRYRILVPAESIRSDATADANISYYSDETLLSAIAIHDFKLVRGILPDSDCEISLGYNEIAFRSLIGAPPMTCPDCGSSDTLREIGYGHPGDELLAASRNDEIILGGCVIDWDSPQVGCIRCRAIHNLADSMDRDIRKFIVENIPLLREKELTLELTPEGFRLSYPAQFTIELTSTAPPKSEELPLHDYFKKMGVNLYLTYRPHIPDGIVPRIREAAKYQYDYRVAFELGTKIYRANKIVITPMNGDEPSEMVITKDDDLFYHLASILSHARPPDKTIHSAAPADLLIAYYCDDEQLATVTIHEFKLIRGILPDSDCEIDHPYQRKILKELLQK